MNETIDHHDTRGHKNIICPILVWDFGQEALTLSVGCYVTIVHTTHIVKCVLVVGMHQNEHGGGTCNDGRGYFWCGGGV